MTGFIENIHQFKNIYKQITKAHKDTTPYLQACCIVLGAKVLLEDIDSSRFTQESLEEIETLKKLSDLRYSLAAIYEEYFIN